MDDKILELKEMSSKLYPDVNNVYSLLKRHFKIGLGGFKDLYGMEPMFNSIISLLDEINKLEVDVEDEDSEYIHHSSSSFIGMFLKALR